MKPEHLITVICGLVLLMVCVIGVNSHREQILSCEATPGHVLVKMSPSGYACVRLAK